MAGYGRQRGDPFAMPAFPAFPSFPPFPGGGLMDAVFGSDPFFSNPTAGPFGNDPFMNHFFGDRAESILRDRSGARAQPPARTGPVIEEITEEEEEQHAASRRGRSGPQRGGAAPRVQEPDDSDRGSGSRARAAPAAASSPFGSLLGGTSSFSFSSSSSSFSGGPGTVYYSSTSTTRMGPGGVVETQTSVRDGTTGTERIVLERKLGDKGRRIVRERDATGREQTIDTLENVREDEISQFDEQWRTVAERALPSSTMARASAGRQQPQALEYGRAGPAASSEARQPRRAEAADQRAVHAGGPDRARSGGDSSAYAPYTRSAGPAARTTGAGASRRY
eukprot:tig00020961_g16762.t1